MGNLELCEAVVTLGQELFCVKTLGQELRIQELPSLRVQYTVYNVQCTVDTVHCTAYSVR